VCGYCVYEVLSVSLSLCLFLSLSLSCLLVCPSLCLSLAIALEKVKELLLAHEPSVYVFLCVCVVKFSLSLYLSATDFLSLRNPAGAVALAASALKRQVTCHNNVHALATHTDHLSLSLSLSLSLPLSLSLSLSFLLSSFAFQAKASDDDESDASEEEHLEPKATLNHVNDQAHDIVRLTRCETLPFFCASFSSSPSFSLPIRRSQKSKAFVFVFLTPLSRNQRGRGTQEQEEAAIISADGAEPQAEGPH
jgi:hypothetical protein